MYSRGSFAGQPLSVGRSVLLAAYTNPDGSTEVRAGICAAILNDGTPVFFDTIDIVKRSDYTFCEAKTPDDLRRLPVGSWTWPPRV